MDVIKEFAAYSSEANFISDIRRFVDKLQNPHNRRRYFYTFSCVSDRNYYTKGVAKYGLHGASHLEDLLYIFDAKKLNMTIDNKSREYELIKKTTNIFGNFIKYGNPTPSPISGLNWPEYNNKDKMYVDINDELKLRQDPGGKGSYTLAFSGCFLTLSAALIPGVRRYEAYPKPNPYHSVWIPNVCRMYCSSTPGLYIIGKGINKDRSSGPRTKNSI
ncbi:hypothetical protein O3G_MSEX001425 [Manduca sexta]|uniref:Carboxylesterase type B domain-containing protein n=1 Tax=Manduca sexta TaxID=7130 RepID=A0A921YKI2_MANSE|nr:hypothetical protein O3G_MSEX001425 [Manduca sexta]